MNDKIDLSVLENNLRQKNWGEVWRFIRQEMQIHQNGRIIILADDEKVKLKELLDNALIATQTEMGKEAIIGQLTIDITQARQEWFV